MSADRFVRWKPDAPRPTRQELQFLLEDYTRGIATSVSWNAEQRRFYVVLPGRPSWPFMRIGCVSDVEKRSYAEETAQGRYRWIEVYFAEGVPDEPLDVITRRGDEITNAIADRIAEIVARFWEGRIER